VVAAVGLFLLVIFSSVCQHQWFWLSMSNGITARAALINTLFARGLALSPSARTAHTNGKLVNHLSTDLSRIDYFFQWCHPVSPSSVDVDYMNIYPNKPP
jgi:ATP-binding cassette subfamily C (CFTR/MRP) protein 1